MNDEQASKFNVERSNMTEFDTKRLSATVDEVAPDGSEVRVLLGTSRGLMGHYTLKPGQVSVALTNRSIDEIWFFLSGSGEMWRKQDQREDIVRVESGTCITIPQGTHFQFRSLSDEQLTSVGITMPPWPGPSEASVVEGRWIPTLSGANASQ